MCGTKRCLNKFSVRLRCHSQVFFKWCGIERISLVDGENFNGSIVEKRTK